VDAIGESPPDDHIEIDEKCVGCVLCREACPYDAIKIKTTLSEPIREPVPVINPKLCLNCGACVAACRTGAIELISSGGEEVHSEIHEEKCIRCGYCARVCPAEAIKYGEILPRSVVGGKAVLVDQNECSGCMTCTRVCPSKGAINIGEVSKLPYIDPSYCARCEECMNVCPSTAIKYRSRDVAYRKFGKIKTMEIVSELLEKESEKLAGDAAEINGILNEIAADISLQHDEDQFEIDVTDILKEEMDKIMDKGFEIEDMVEIIERTTPQREITVSDEKCIGCSVCVEECPVNCIEPGQPSPIDIGEECVHCGKCVQICPVEAISHKEELFDTIEDRILFIRRNVLETRSGTVVPDHAICQACGICVNKCPVGALSLDNDEIVVNSDKCILCGECEVICPLNAIKLELNQD
jgi:energy-converting hydrogenase A subunit Q